MRAARAAGLFFFNQPIRSLFLASSLPLSCSFLKLPNILNFYKPTVRITVLDSFMQFSCQNSSITQSHQIINRINQWYIYTFHLQFTVIYLNEELYSVFHGLRRIWTRTMNNLNYCVFAPLLFAVKVATILTLLTQSNKQDCPCFPFRLGYTRLCGGSSDTRIPCGY